MVGILTESTSKEKEAKAADSKNDATQDGMDLMERKRQVKDISNVWS